MTLCTWKTDFSDTFFPFSIHTADTTLGPRNRIIGEIPFLGHIWILRVYELKLRYKFPFLEKHWTLRSANFKLHDTFRRNGWQPTFHLPNLQFWVQKFRFSGDTWQILNYKNPRFTVSKNPPGLQTGSMGHCGNHTLWRCWRPTPSSTDLG